MICIHGEAVVRCGVRFKLMSKLDYLCISVMGRLPLLAGEGGDGGKPSGQCYPLPNPRVDADPRTGGRLARKGGSGSIAML